jgi:hypothetical protein
LEFAQKTSHQKPAPKPNTNCGTCNTVKGCGGDNLICKPNTTPNCGCRLA